MKLAITSKPAPLSIKRVRGGVPIASGLRGGAFEGYLEVEFAKQGKNKGTSPRK